MWVVLRPRLPGFDLVWAYGRGLGPGLTSESADAASGCPANRSVGRVPGFPGTHRRCRPDLPCLDKRRGFTGPTASGCVPPLQPQKRDGMSIVETRAITGGVDTHADVHVAAALDPIGGLLGGRGFPGGPGALRPPPGVAGWVRDRLPGRERRHRQLWRRPVPPRDIGRCPGRGGG